MTRAMLLALVMLGCGEGGGAAAPTEAPLCDPPEGLACPEGMREERVHDDHGEGVFCWEGDARHPLIRHRDGQVLWYSPPPFETMTQCWPVAVAETVYSVGTGYGTSDPASICYDEGGAAEACETVTPRLNEAWGLAP